MRLYWGNYAHDDAECVVAESIDVLETDTGLPYGIRVRWDVTGVKLGDDLEDVVAKMNALQSAYLVWGKDLVLRDGDGNLVKQMRTLGSISGVQIVKPPAWPIQGGAELTGFCSYALAAEAEYLIGSTAFPGAVPPYRSFRETLSFGGGGPVKTVVNVVNGPPQIQVLYAKTAYTATQSGEAVGVNGWPPLPPPLWPAFLLRPGQGTKGSPRRHGPGLTDYPVTWSYEFASPGLLVGNPKVPPLGAG